MPVPVAPASAMAVRHPRQQYQVVFPLSNRKIIGHGNNLLEFNNLGSWAAVI
jgi:hypothetical protein